MALTKAARDALSLDDFAVPETRALPIPDERHVEMAWQSLDAAKGLSEETKSNARHRILERAKAFEMDTTGWSTIKAMAFEAMSLNVPTTEDHPNKLPFSGILTRLDKPSDAAPHGSGGRKVMLPKVAAEAALATLLGMAVDYTPNFNGHDAQKKIGVITAATIHGDAIHIEGLLWAADFPDATARIQATKDILGFSYEMKNVHVVDPGADTLVIDRCDFTGAAILKKADAAYHTTSLAASKDGPEEKDIMFTKEELAEMLAAAVKPLTEKITALEAGQGKITTDLAASKEAEGKVRPHSDAIRAAADGMKAAGMGGHPTSGHVVRLNKMADSMDASAAMGNIPHIYRDHDFTVDASTDNVVKPDPAIAEIKASIAALGTQVVDLGKKAFNAAAEPERKTLPADIALLLNKNGIDAGAEGVKVTPAQISEIAGKAGLDRTATLALKLEAQQAGLFEAA